MQNESERIRKAKAEVEAVAVAAAEAEAAAKAAAEGDAWVLSEDEGGDMGPTSVTLKSRRTVPWPSCWRPRVWQAWTPRPCVPS